MAVIREHLAAKGLGLHNDLQNESSIVGNMPTVLMFRDFGTPEQNKGMRYPRASSTARSRSPFGLTEPNHGSDATWMETRGGREGDGWRINGEKIWNTGLHVATHDFVFARTSGRDGGAQAASPASSSRPEAKVSRSKNTCGPSICRPTIRAFR